MLSKNAYPLLFSRWQLDGSTVWKPQRIVWTSLLMAWDEGQTLTSRWQHTEQLVRQLHPHWKRGWSYSGFAQAWTRWLPRIVPTVVRRFQRQMEEQGQGNWRRNGWCVLAVDGSRLETPHTEANERGLGCAGREKTAPQVFLTTLWHVGLTLPWDFRVGPGIDSERRHLEAMVPGLPRRTLLLADAGFISYALCEQLRQAGHGFLLRVGGNITLLTKLGYDVEERDGRVYLWPRREQRRRPPVVLRLIELVKGQQRVCLVTNLLDRKQLSDGEAAAWYASRWGVEIFYRSYKQTLERRTLASRTPETCLSEAQATFLGLWLLGLMTVTQQIPVRLDPQGWSVARARDAVRQATRQVLRKAGGGRSFLRALQQARKDNYSRRHEKAARNYPRKKREQPPGPPKIRAATKLERKRALKVREKESVLRRTA